MKKVIKIILRILTVVGLLVLLGWGIYDSIKNLMGADIRTILMAIAAVIVALFIAIICGLISCWAWSDYLMEVFKDE